MTVGRIRLPRLGAVLLAAGLLAACSTTAGGPSSSTASPSRPTDLRDAQAVYLAFDHSASRWQSYSRLYSAPVATGAGRPLLPEGVVTRTVQASADGSVIVYDASLPVPRGSAIIPAPPTWWWSDSTRTEQVTGMPADVRAFVVTPDGHAVIAAVGSLTGARWSLVRIDLGNEQQQPICDGCLLGRPDFGITHGVLAISSDGSLLASSTWGTNQVSCYYGCSTSSAANEQVRSLPDGTVRWRSDQGFCMPVTVSADGTLVRTCSKDNGHPQTIHELTGAFGPSPVDRETGLPGDLVGAAPGGWWYTTQRENDPNGPVTIHATTALTPASSTVVATWPGGAQINAIALTEVTHIAWSGPVPSSA